MKKSTKTAIVVGGGIAGALIIAGIWEHYAHAAQACKCPDGSPCPGGDPTKCPQLGQSVGPSSDSGQTYTYNGQVQPDVMQRAQALAAVDPCDPANEPLVRYFQGSAGLVTLPGSPSVAPDWNTVTPPGTDGRYASNTHDVLAKYVPNPPPACARKSKGGTVTWWGKPGLDSNAVPSP